jgi:signal transduction histidine kinase
MDPESQSHSWFSRLGLRARIALGVALPILLALTLLSVVRYRHERALVEDQLRLTVLQVGQVMIGSLRHTMLLNDGDMLAQTLVDISSMGTVQQIQIVDLAGRVKVSNHNAEVGTVRRLDDLGCIECHQFPAGSRSQTSRLLPSSDVMRVSVPIANDASCAGCHSQQDAHLGVLLADISTVNIESRLRYNLQVDLATSLGSTVFITLVLYLLIHWLVVRRVEAFHRPLAQFAAGNLASRLPLSPGSNDELGDLAYAFNRMAGELEHQIEEREKRTELRQRAIIEERERIARELHDGLAQLLGYVNTKAMAVRLMFLHNQTEEANQNLYELEEAARGLFVDVREAILGLKMAGQDHHGLCGGLQEYIRRFGKLSNLPVELVIAPEVEACPLTAEAELQLLRIVQESLTNTRKHASATQVRIKVGVEDGGLVLLVSDDGHGFDLDGVETPGATHFGFGIMNERAKAIGARFHLDSQPGRGTQITVRLPLREG